MAVGNRVLGEQPIVCRQDLDRALMSDRAVLVGCRAVRRPASGRSYARTSSAVVPGERSAALDRGSRRRPHAGTKTTDGNKTAPQGSNDVQPRPGIRWIR
jgi:hypothetical protein